MLPVAVLAALAALALLVVGSDGRAVANPAYGTLKPDPQVGFVIHGNIFSIKTRFTTCATTSDPLCHLGGYEVKLSWDASKVSLVTDSGTSSGGNTTTTLRDTTKAWKINQWRGSRVRLVGGAGAIGADGNQQTRIVASNTADTLTVFPAWDGPPVPLPSTTTFYVVGGMTNSDFLTSTGRTAICQNPDYVANTASLECVTLGAPQQGYPDGPVGAGQVTNLVMKADNKGTFTLALVTPDTRVLALDGTTIPADIISGTRRIVRCPDANGNNVVNILDLFIIGQALGATPGSPLWSDGKNPDENSVINILDLQIAAGVIDNKCVQN